MHYSVYTCALTHPLTCSDALTCPHSRENVLHRSHTTAICDFMLTDDDFGVVDIDMDEGMKNSCAVCASGL